MQLALSRAILNRRRFPRPARYAVAVILVAAWSGIPAAALAQRDPLPQVNGKGPLPAPVGHRQPRAQDLPPDVLRDEGMTRRPPEPAPTILPDASLPDASGDRGDQSAGQVPFDNKELQICRGC
jgi:hypothetical protein